MGSIGQEVPDSSLFYQSAYKTTAPIVVSASGHYFTLENGQRVLDSSCGAAVSGIGHGNARVKDAIVAQLNKLTYAHPGYFQNLPALELADFLVKSTGGKLSRACLVGSGSEAVEAAMKLAMQYHLEVSPDSARVNFIARRGSWHGCTLGTLALGDFKPRKQLFESALSKNVSHVSPCHPYRELREGETSKSYVARLAQELEDEFQRLGPDTVCAFVVEPMVGTALGCVAPVPGYLRAMKEVCQRHKALLIFDEVMCGLGRSGTLHTWEQEDVVPDIQAVGKGLAAGYGTISALLIHEDVITGLKAGSGSFQHGQTYQCHPLNVVAALEVQRIVQENDLVNNARVMGDYLGQLLKKRFENHPNVGDVRGRGLFWCIEFVADKSTKAPMNPKLNVAKRLRLRGLEKGYDVCLFSATGCADGWIGDHFLLAPALDVSRCEIDEIVYRAGRVVDSVFAEL
ncbi:putative aminotransferase [Lachnellula cervina]|uniref:Putative aminotransferase n=1 Tax=Lachnellula cervina TaxID=1316786 RepID=A0A7D8Z4T1_9HELO|nr:putative aminotransferase [Lachnellula cervina]